MKNLLISGDSWGIGVFAGKGDSYGPTGEGIHTILTGLGHKVTNISKGGGSNWLMVDRLENHWENTGRCLFGIDPNDRVAFDLKEIDYIIFLQTDIFRERHYYGIQYLTDTHTRWKILEQQFILGLLKYDSFKDIIDDYFIKLYTKLNQFDKKILMIGGWSQLHPSIINYNNLIPVIESATKLLIPQLDRDVYLSDPEWYSQLANDTKVMAKFGKELKQMTIDAETKLKLIYKNWNGEVHPDLQGYQKLTDALVKYF